MRAGNLFCFSRQDLPMLARLALNSYLLSQAFQVYVTTLGSPLQDRSKVHRRQCGGAVGLTGPRQAAGRAAAQEQGTSSGKGEENTL